MGRTMLDSIFSHCVSEDESKICICLVVWIWTARKTLDLHSKLNLAAFFNRFLLHWCRCWAFAWALSEWCFFTYDDFLDIAWTLIRQIGWKIQGSEKLRFVKYDFSRCWGSLWNCCPLWASFLLNNAIIKEAVPQQGYLIAVSTIRVSTSMLPLLVVLLYCSSFVSRSYLNLIREWMP